MKTQCIAVIAVAMTIVCQAARSQITIACAANMQFAMEEITAACAKSGIHVKPVYGASGKFVSQIKNGAPFDVFVSADMDYPESLFVWKYAATKPKVYAYGKLVLWSTKPGFVAKGIAGLADSGIKTIAIADPRLAPYGREALHALKNANVYSLVSARLVFGESVSQAAQYIVSGSADVGFTAQSIVLSPQMHGKGSWVDIDSSLYDKIAQGIVVCRYGEDNNPESSKAFLSFLCGSQSRDILKRFGYSLP